MLLKFSCADFTFPLLKHQDVLTLIKMMGFDGVDVGLFEERSHLQPSTEFRDVHKSAAVLRRRLDDTGLLAADVFMQTALDFTAIAPNHPDRAVRQRNRDWYLKTLEYAKIAGSQHVSVLPGVAFEQEEYQASLNRCMEELSWRIGQAKEYGLVLGIEAHVDSIADTPQKAYELVGRVDGLTLTLDYTHFTKIGIPDSEIDILLPFASHFHARGAAPGSLQCMVSQNTIDYAAIARRLNALDYKGYIGIEYTWNDWENCNRNDNVAESILLKELITKAFQQ